jgi:WD40 repeat protein
VAFTRDGLRLASVGADQSLCLLHGHLGRLSALAFSPDGVTLASASSGELGLRLWDWRAGREHERRGGFRREVLALAFDAQGKRLAAGSMDGTALLLAFPD